VKRNRSPHEVNPPDGQLGSRKWVAALQLGLTRRRRCRPRSTGAYFQLLHPAEVAELVDALDLGSSGVTRPGSSPGFRMQFLPQ
jgi:hypothetical protein